MLAEPRTNADALAESQPMTDSPNEFLSQHDVTRLLEDNSIDSRVEIASKISQQYSQHRYSADEQRYAEQIFRLLMRDGEMRVRQELAKRLDTTPHAPRDVILSLANDHERVAMSVLRNSQVLSDADLIRITEKSDGLGKLTAIAARSSLSMRVSHTLIATHYPQVVQTLLQNNGASISQQDYTTILQEHGVNSVIADSLARRPDLPLPVVEGLISKVSSDVAATLKQKYKIETDQVRRQSQESMLIQLISPHASESEISETVNQMAAFGRLTATVLLSALCRGHLVFFEIGMAKLAGIPKPNARKLIRDKGVYGFQALYQKVHMPESLFDAVRLLLHAVLALEANKEIDVGSKLYAGFIIDHMTRQTEGKAVDNLDYLIELIRHSADTPLRF